MTNKELQEKLKQYPDDAVVHAELFTRNGRGGAFREDLLLSSMGYFEKENTLHIGCAFQIGWLNAHPEFQPPSEPEEDDDEEPEETGGSWQLTGLMGKERTVDTCKHYDVFEDGTTCCCLGGRCVDIAPGMCEACREKDAVNDDGRQA